MWCSIVAYGGAGMLDLSLLRILTADGTGAQTAGVKSGSERWRALREVKREGSLLAPDNRGDVVGVPRERRLEAGCPAQTSWRRDAEELARLVRLNLLFLVATPHFSY